MFGIMYVILIKVIWNKFFDSIKDHCKWTYLIPLGTVFNELCGNIESSLEWPDRMKLLVDRLSINISNWLKWMSWYHNKLFRINCFESVVIWDLKTLGIKNSEYESQANKMVPIVIFTISHFWSPTLTNIW